MDLRILSERVRLIGEIQNNENKQRRADSMKQVEIFNDRLFQYVWENLRKKYSANTVNEMPLVASINLSRRIVKNEASIYKEPPKRVWSELSEKQTETTQLIYDDMFIDSKLMKSNESFKLQNQNHFMVIPKNGQLIGRILRNHHLDSIPDPNDPETALGYAISAFDKHQFLENFKDQKSPTGFKGTSQHTLTNRSNRTNETIGDPDDYRSVLQRYVIWTKEFIKFNMETEQEELVPGLNFIMNGKGDIVSGEDIFSPIPTVLPIIDISIEKDFEYWVRQGEAVTDFCIDYNVAFSSLSQIVEMQGFAQAFLKGPKDLIPESIVVGPNHILKLPIDPDNPTDTEFGYASPNPDVSGSISYIETLLSNFLSSRGIDPKTITGKADVNKFSSGIERLLSMLEKFEASKEDHTLYEKTEIKIWELIKMWHNALKGTDKLDDKYTTNELPEDSRISVVFDRPEMIQTEQEKVDLWDSKREKEFASRLDAIADIHNMGREEAKEKAKQIIIDEIELDKIEMETRKKMGVIDGNNNFGGDQDSSVGSEGAVSGGQEPSENRGGGDSGQEDQPVPGSEQESSEQGEV